MRLILLLFGFLAGLAVGPLHAGDVSQTRVLGFSADGRYFAYEIYGVQDGSGMPYSEIYVVDVPRNAFATRALKLRTQEGDGDAASLRLLREQAGSQAKMRLREFDIQSDLVGQELVNHPLSDLTGEGRYAKFTTRHMAYVADPTAEYELFLDESTTGEKCYYMEARIFTLRLVHQGKTKILQADKRLPASRGCVYKYRIAQVLCHKNSLVVLLHLFKPGFEGPDVRQMVVTGTLDF